MKKYRVECLNGSKYFNEDEKMKADIYFNNRVQLGIPAQFWEMNITALKSTQVLIKYFEY